MTDNADVVTTAGTVRGSREQAGEVREDHQCVPRGSLRRAAPWRAAFQGPRAP